ncbi:MAG: hypothetical protein JXA24_00155 [Proteobacteria bacterium]|nr:hypothetical protein [Pseudomonadota bacterium]
MCAKGPEAGRSAQGSIRYAWAGPSIDGALWGMAQGDVDGDGAVETVLLARRRILVGRIGDAGFEQAFECRWGPAADAARVSLVDLDGDARLEAAISAVEEGMPSSLVLGIDMAARSCSEIATRVRRSLRAVELFDDAGAPRRALAGQGWSPAEFFSGAVRELALSKGKLAPGPRISLPRHTGLFQFAMLPPRDGAERCAVLRGPAHMEVHAAAGRGRWKRVWRSGERLGGSANFLPAEQRPALDQVASELAVFDMSPVALGDSILAVKADMPAHDIVGTAPYVRGAEAVEFAPDPALGYVEGRRTQWISGAAVELMADPAGLTMLVQESAGAFGTPDSTRPFRFDL